jgi:hypothetical protein
MKSDEAEQRREEHYPIEAEAHVELTKGKLW